MEKINIIEIVKERNALQRELKEEYALWELNQNNSLDKQNQEIRIERIKTIQKQLKQIEEIFREYATFDTSEFTVFMTKFLTLTEGEDFKRTEYYMGGIVKEESPTRIIITDKTTSDFLKKIVHTKKDVEELFQERNNGDIIKFNGKKLYPFKKDLNMREKFAKHQRLKIAIYELMQLKIDNPELSDEERYEIVLNNTVTRNLNRSDKAYFEAKKRV